MQKGLSAPDAAKTLHPVQQAWIDEQVPQWRLLPKRYDDRRGAAARQEPESNGRLKSRMLSPTRRHRLTCAAAALTPLSSMPWQRAATAMRAGKQAAR